MQYKITIETEDGEIMRKYRADDVNEINWNEVVVSMVDNLEDY